MSIDYEKLKILPLNFPKSYSYVYYLCFLGERLRKAGIELHIRYCFAFSQRRFSRCIARFSLWRRNGLHKPQNAFGVKAVRKAHFAVVGAHFQPVTICNSFIFLCAKYARLNCEYRQKCRQQKCCRHFCLCDTHLLIKNLTEQNGADSPRRSQSLNPVNRRLSSLTLQAQTWTAPRACEQG